ncbi:MAG: RNA 2',3'-cyclic phosphodiesterase [Opitutales bacterium]
MEANAPSSEARAALPPRRLFFALPLPDFVREKLFELDEGESSIRPVAGSKLHLTLRFFGEVEPEMTDAIIDAVSGIAARPFLLHLEGVGCFPSEKRPRVLWAGVGKGHPHLFSLQKQLEDVAANLGFPLENTHFTPHVTVARCPGASPELVRQWLKRNKDFGTAPFQVDHFVLYRSRPPDGAAPYQVVREFPLMTSDGPGV